MVLLNLLTYFYENLKFCKILFCKIISQEQQTLKDCEISLKKKNILREKSRYKIKFMYTFNLDFARLTVLIAHSTLYTVHCLLYTKLQSYTWFTVQRFVHTLNILYLCVYYVNCTLFDMWGGY